MEMKDRIKLLMENQHLTQQSFAQMTEISPASLSSIFTGRTNPTLNHVMLIKKKIPNLNTDWLLYGNGPMFLNQNGGDPSKADTNTNVVEPAFDFDNTKPETTPTTQTPQVRKPVENIVEPAARGIEKTVVKFIDKPQRKVAQIQVIYDDDTIEIFVPKK